jgi:hypothetical protein
MTEFGLTPSSRVRLGQKTDSQPDDIEGLLRSHG